MNALNGQEILTTVQKICSFGPRWMGTEAVAHVVDFIRNEFEKSGLNADLETFRYLSYSPGKAFLSVDGRDIRCEPIALSQSTAEDLKAPLVYGGQCLQEDLDALKAKGVDLQGSIVLSENLRSFVAYPQVQAVGAVGFISLTTLPGNIIRCGCARLDRKPGKIPAIAIGGDEGKEIVKKLESGKRLMACLGVEGVVEEKEGANVIGRKAGPSVGSILITAHYDSFWNGVHAMDNAAGTATVIALSRILIDAIDQNLEFVVFGGEELGFWGSSSYVRAHHSSLDKIIAMVNLDTFGSNRSQLEVGATPDLIEFCRRIAKEQNIRVDCWNVPPRAASDQHSFVESGVSAIWLANCGADQRYHTPLDVPAEMSPQNIGKAAELAYALVKNFGSPPD